MGVRAGATEMAARSLPIIAYHFVGAREHQYSFRDDELPYVTDAATFGDHLAGLVQAGFRAVSLEQVLRSRDLPPKPVVLTFDDGHASFADVALGLLAQYGYTATLFMVTDFIGRQDYLTREQLGELGQQGIEIGPHGCSHRPLTAIPVSEMRDEVRRSKQVLEEITGRSCGTLALPHGFGSRDVEQAARDAGYEAICTSRFGINPVPPSGFCLDRISVKNPLPWSDLQALLEPGSGAYRRAVIKDRLKGAAKWLLQTHKRCE